MNKNKQEQQKLIARSYSDIGSGDSFRLDDVDTANPIDFLTKTSVRHTKTGNVIAIDDYGNAATMLRDEDIVYIKEIEATAEEYIDFKQGALKEFYLRNKIEPIATIALVSQDARNKKSLEMGLAYSACMLAGPENRTVCITDQLEKLTQDIDPILDVFVEILNEFDARTNQNAPITH